MHHWIPSENRWLLNSIFIFSLRTTLAKQLLEGIQLHYTLVLCFQILYVLIEITCFTHSHKMLCLKEDKLKPLHPEKAKVSWYKERGTDVVGWTVHGGQGDCHWGDWGKEPGCSLPRVGTSDHGRHLILRRLLQWPKRWPAVDGSAQHQRFSNLSLRTPPWDNS